MFLISFTVFSSLLSYDTTLRCNFVDLYYTLFGRQKIVRAEVAALYKPIKVEVEVNCFPFIINFYMYIYIYILGKILHSSKYYC